MTSVDCEARLDLISKALAEAKSSMADRKTVAIRREMVTKVDEVESKVLNRRRAANDRDY